MLILFNYSEYIDNASSNHTTETLSLTRDDILTDDNNCTCILTTCSKLVINELWGVVCADYTNSSMVRKE